MYAILNRVKIFILLLVFLGGLRAVVISIDWREVDQRVESDSFAGQLAGVSAPEPPLKKGSDCI